MQATLHLLHGVHSHQGEVSSGCTVSRRAQSAQHSVCSGKVHSVQKEKSRVANDEPGASLPCLTCAPPTSAQARLLVSMSCVPAVHASAKCSAQGSGPRLTLHALQGAASNHPDALASLLNSAPPTEPQMMPPADLHLLADESHTVTCPTNPPIVSTPCKCLLLAAIIAQPALLRRREKLSPPRLD